MSVRFDAWPSSRARHQAARNMQTLAFLWFDLQLARSRLQEAFAEPELLLNTANLNEPGGSPVRQLSSAPILRSAGAKYEVPLRTKQTQTNRVCGSLN